TIYFCHKQKLPFLVIGDAAATVTPLGIITGRTANFINGELWGRPLAEGSSAWGIKFPSSLQADLALQNKTPMLLDMYYKLEPGSPEWISFVNQHVLTRHPSQLYAVFMEGLVVFAIAMFFHKKHRRPGLSIGIVIFSYSIMRFLNEFLRQPDEGYELFFGWMSKGQALSFPVLIVGALFIYFALKRPARPELYTAVQQTTKDKNLGHK
ncbi:MAG: prolipoprotein diacylglyceryl transferase, partial [Planctomycetes bacterium]|nr:prolipoprotein diacylglyceryl transferase [Planctomycetota bacterium]